MNLNLKELSKLNIECLKSPVPFSFCRVVMGQKSTYYAETFCYTFAKGHVYGKDTASIGI